MATPEERPPEPHGTPRSGKMGKFRIESGILGIPAPAFRFLSSLPYEAVSSFLSLPRWVFDVNGRPRGTPPGTSRNPTERQEAAKLGNYEYNPEFYGFMAQPFVFLLRHPTTVVSAISHFRVGR